MAQGSNCTNLVIKSWQNEVKSLTSFCLDMGYSLSKCDVIFKIVANRNVKFARLVLFCMVQTQLFFYLVLSYFC